MMSNWKKGFGLGIPAFLFISFFGAFPTVASEIKQPKELQQKQAFGDYFYEYFNSKMSDFRSRNAQTLARIKIRLKLDELFHTRSDENYPFLSDYETFLDKSEEDVMKSVAIRSLTHALNKTFEEKIANLKERFADYFNLEWVTYEREEGILYPEEESKFSLGKPSKYGFKFSGGLNASTEWNDIEFLKRVDNLDDWKIWYDKKIFIVNVRIGIENEDDKFTPGKFKGGLYKEFSLNRKPLDIGLFSSFEESENYFGIGFNYPFSF